MYFNSECNPAPLLPPHRWEPDASHFYPAAESQSSPGGGGGVNTDLTQLLLILLYLFIVADSGTISV